MGENAVNPSPLVSIIVITYNCAQYVIETLESAKMQTYKNIELIVSDDCSTDNTVEICIKWIAEYKSRFVMTKLINVSENTGIPANLNRGIKAASGEWLKPIAGDDILLNDCIGDYIEYVVNSCDPVFAVHANMNVYNNNFKPENFKSAADYSGNIFNKRGISAYQQFVLLLRYPYIGAPTVFLKKSLIVKLGYYDERVKYEDWPMHINITKNGNKIYHLNKITVNYRIRCNSIYNNNSGQELFNYFYVYDKNVYTVYRKAYLTLFERCIEELEYKRKWAFSKMGMNKYSYFNYLINNFCSHFYELSKRFAFYAANRIFKWL